MVEDFLELSQKPSARIISSRLISSPSFLQPSTAYQISLQGLLVSLSITISLLVSFVAFRTVTPNQCNLIISRLQPVLHFQLEIHINLLLAIPVRIVPEDYRWPSLNEKSSSETSSRLSKSRHESTTPCSCSYHCHASYGVSDHSLPHSYQSV